MMIILPSSIATIAVGIVIYLLLNPEKAQIWGSAIASLFSSSNNFFARLRISGKIQGKINQFAKKMNNEGSGIMPYNLKVQWVKERDIEALLKEEGVVIVRLSRQHNDIEKALALAMLTFCTKALIPQARPYISQDLSRSIDLVTTKKMLNEAKAKGSVDYFMTEVLKPEIDSKPELTSHCQVIEKIDERGLYSRVLLKELQEVGRKAYPEMPNGVTALECEEFVAFLFEIASKPPDEDVELNFSKSKIRVHLLLVARPEVIAERGFEPYLKQLEKHFKRGAETVYITGMGDNVGYTKKIAALAEKRRFGVVASSDDYDIKGKGYLIPAVCISLSMNRPKRNEAGN